MTSAVPRVTEAWAAGPIGMGPRACFDEDHQLALAGDLALTGTAALATELGLPPDPVPTDAELVLAAYRRWGLLVPERLDGEFAFALWDGRRRLLLCVRDRFGVKPFYFQMTPATIAFGTVAGAVSGAAGVPRRLNHAAVAAYLAADFNDKGATGFANLSRLEPGQAMVVDAGRATFRAYWSPDAVTELRLESDAEYEEAFRHALTEAVAWRVGAGPVGVSLSGGLDSSSLACIAGRLPARPLHAYSATFGSDRASDERVWVAAAVRQAGAIARGCDTSATSPLADWAGASWTGASPAGNPNVSVCRVTLEAAAEDGVPVVLHGFGGDAVVSHGTAYLAELARAGRLARLAAEGRAVSRRHGATMRRVVLTRAIRPNVPEPAVRAWRWARHRPRSPSATLLRPEVARRFGLDGTNATAMAMATSSRRDHVDELLSGTHAHVLEANYEVDAVIGVERRYPFLDRGLVELCLSLPGDQKLRDGWTRSIMRRALTGVLPEEVRQRPGKANLGPAFVRALASTDGPVLEGVAARPGALGEWVDPSQVRALWQRCVAGAGSDDWFAMWRLAVAARWLTYHGFDDTPRSTDDPAVSR